MALDFPANPTNGQVYDSYVYNSTVGAWQAREDSATVAITSPTAPATANNGDIWYNSNTGVSYVYYADGSSAQWVEIVSSAVPLLDSKADLAGGNSFTGAQTITSTATTQIPLIVNGIASQTADLQQWNDNVGTILSRVSNNGTGYFKGVQSGSASFSGITWNGISNPLGATTLPSLIIKGIASQTADLQQWQNSGGTVLAEIDSAGTLTTPRVISTQATGTAPFTVASTTVVSNLNADMIDGYHESALVLTRGTGLSTNSTDFNTIVTPGSYGVGGNGNWTGSTNGPTTAYAYGQLVVTVNGNIVTQSYYTHSTGGHFIRTKYNASDWQAWQRISSDYNVTAIGAGGTGSTTAAGARTNLGLEQIKTLYGSFTATSYDSGVGNSGLVWWGEKTVSFGQTFAQIPTISVYCLTTGAVMAATPIQVSTTGFTFRAIRFQATLGTSDFAWSATGRIS